ncbi:hypothetical protein BGZ65_010983, partial [Modicella reniformis]
MLQEYLTAASSHVGYDLSEKTVEFAFGLKVFAQGVQTPIETTSSDVSLFDSFMKRVEDAEIRRHVVSRTRHADRDK